MKSLNRNTASLLHTRPVVILQFGGGNFLRGFLDWYIDILNKDHHQNIGVALVKPTPQGEYTRLVEQDGLYHTILHGLIDNKLSSDVRLIDCIQQIVNPYKNFEDYLSLAENPDIKYIVSNTTEAGIEYSGKEKMSDQPAMGFPAKLTQWLWHRYVHFNGMTSAGIIILPCELIERNGTILKEAVLKYCDQWALNQGFKTWLDECCHFFNTLVDRIIAGYPSDGVKKLHDSIGFNDRAMVTGELYESWKIESPKDVFKAIPWDKASSNIQLVADLDVHRNIKVKILNGAHTAMVPIGILYGVKTVGEFMGENRLCSFIEEMLFSEVIPTIDLDQNILKSYVSETLDRFRNPTISHRLEDIALNSISKFKVRLLPTLLDHHMKFKTIPDGILTAMAALIRFYEGSWKGQVIPLRDSRENTAYFGHLWNQVQEGDISIQKMTEEILSNQALWDQDLTNISGLHERLVEKLTHIHLTNSIF